MAVGSLLSLGGSSIATASAAESAVDESTGSSSTASAAAQLSETHAEISEAAEAGDVDRTAAGVERAQSLLGEIAGGERYNLPSEVSEQAAAARTEADRVAAGLEELDGTEPRILGTLNNLVQGLLMTIADLVDSVLGGGIGADLPGGGVADLPGGDMPELPTEDSAEESGDESEDDSGESEEGGDESGADLP
ncbi:hypothetical protein H0B56_17925 [Haloechinothrix sp. YIM 98757]|uniref:Uncharacterized protein n=1 Tax=Haloechinothrix aidingensis TaxID=2752311 RepID=A0A838AE75_9PSEU|nr:hypothetical protein [Haloechinothrix aidingensis]MBA0127428.1 hypothetical protein [Haloechinothrix aidingensis]